MQTTQNGASALMETAAERCRTRDCEHAIGLLEAAAQLQPTNATIQYYLGICYSGGCRHHSLADIEAAHLHLTNAHSLLAPSADPAERAKVLSALGNTYAASRNMPAKPRLMAAIECYEQAGQIFQAAGRLDDWAREEFNLGNAFSELPEGSVSSKWEQAIRHYENGLQIRTRQKDPNAYAGTLQNLGIALREVRSGNHAENIKQSLLCYRRALQVRRRWSHPRAYAALQINVGNSFVSLASVDKPNAIRHRLRALRHYDRALALCSEENLAGEYATVLFNRGETLVLIARETANPDVYLREACACFQEAVAHLEQLHDSELAKRSRDWLNTVLEYLDMLQTTGTFDMGT
jgi:tetratricopeptide (TPR) repeat protein